MKPLATDVIWMPFPVMLRQMLKPGPNGLWRNGDIDRIPKLNHIFSRIFPVYAVPMQFLTAVTSPKLIASPWENKHAGIV